MINLPCFVESGFRVLRPVRFPRINPVYISFIVAGLSALSVGCSKSKVEPFNQAGSEKNYSLGKKVIFGEDGDSERFRVSGWSATEKEITWTDGPVAVLQFAGLPASTSFRLKMTLAALVNPPELPAQPVQVFANGEKVAEWQVVDKASFTALIPPKDDTTTLNIELRLPKAVSPKDLGISSDARVLGVSCFDIVITKVG